MLIIDTLSTTRRFQNAGMPPEQADVLTETFREVQEQNIENLATKDDLERQSNDFKKDFRPCSRIVKV